MTEMMIGHNTATFSKSKRAVTARQQRVIELAALGVPMEKIAKMMGSVRIDTIRDLLDRALAAQAETLREEGAWERAYVLQTARLDMLMRTWMPKALAGDDKAADKVDKWLTHYERLQGLAAPQRLEAAVTVDDTSVGRAAVIDAVLARLDDVKMRQQIIDGQAVEVTAEETS
jgi:hypothetical protein